MSSPAPALHPRPGLKQVFITKPFDILDTRKVFVIPAKVHLGGDHPPKEIQWINQTGGPVTIWLPNAGKYAKQYKDPRTHRVHQFKTPFPLAPNGVLTVAVKEELRDGYYEYNVYCEEIQGYAQGDSGPGVIYP